MVNGQPDFLTDYWGLRAELSAVMASNSRPTHLARIVQIHSCYEQVVSGRVTCS